MKKALLIGAIGLFFASLVAYQPLEHGLFYAHSLLYAPAYEYKKSTIIFEKREDGTNSRVMCVNGTAQFQHFILQDSLIKPIIVKVYSNGSADALKMSPVIQAIADRFESLNFIAVDVLEKSDGEQENSQIIAKLMELEKLGNLELPVLLIFRDGGLFKSMHAPVGVLQGFYTKENLEHLLQAMFIEKENLSAIGLDMTKTITNSLSKPASKKPQSMWQRVEKWFKKK